MQWLVISVLTEWSWTRTKIPAPQPELAHADLASCYEPRPLPKETGTVLIRINQPRHPWNPIVLQTWARIPTDQARQQCLLQLYFVLTNVSHREAPSWLMLRLLLRGLLPTHSDYVVWRSGNIPRNSCEADSQNTPVMRLNYKCVCSEGCISWLLAACLTHGQQLVRCRMASHIALIKSPSKPSSALEH